MQICLKIRKLVLTDPSADQYTQVTEEKTLESRHTAVLVCDMRKQYWCENVQHRMDEMAPRMNAVLNALRESGATAAFASRDSMKFYENHPARIQTLQEAEKAKRTPPEGRKQRRNFYMDGSAREADLVCEDEKLRAEGSCYRQMDALEIHGGDLMGSGAELLRAFYGRGIEHVILMGVHTNAAMLGGDYGVYALKEAGFDPILMRDLSDCVSFEEDVPYTDHFTAADLVVWHMEKCGCESITSDQVLCDGAPFRSSEDARAVVYPYKNFRTLPATDWHWDRVKDYIEPVPNPDYSQASDAAVESFKDMKYTVRIHWGIYSMLHLNGESWRYLKMSFEDKQKYCQLYHSFNPYAFNAEAWMEFFERAGFKGFMFTTKHHEGFSMFDTKTRVHRRVNWTAENGPQIEACNLAYSIMETPFHRDIVKELCDAAHRHDMKIDLYFSHPDWYDADFRPYNYHPCNSEDMNELLIQTDIDELKPEDPRMNAPAVSEEEKTRMLARHREQLREILTRYGKIDMMCLDQWFGPKIWPDIRETVKMARQLQPDVMLRCRGIGSYGDYYTPEGFVPGAKENTNMPWMVIHSLGESFSYDENGANYRDAQWVVHNLLDIISKGGNFMVGIGPDEYGLFHPQAVRVLEEAGRWIHLHRKGIYGTRERSADLYREGDSVVYTRSKDNKTVYAYALKWPGEFIRLRKVRPKEGTDILMTGWPVPLPYEYEDGVLTIHLPEQFQIPENRPCQYAWCFEIESEF